MAVALLIPIPVFVLREKGLFGKCQHRRSPDFLRERGDHDGSVSYWIRAAMDPCMLTLNFKGRGRQYYPSPGYAYVCVKSLSGFLIRHVQRPTGYPRTAALSQTAVSKNGGFGPVFFGL